jgi:hypothetical protein
MNRATTVGILGLLLAATLAGCGGGGGGGGSSSTPAPTPTQNVQPVIVDAGPAGYPNILFVSVTVCAPGGTTNCQTIDHVQVDTGSSGLRLFSSVLSPALSLRQETDASGNPLVACAQFADGYSWGPVKVADIHIAGEQASSVPVQIIGDPGFPAIPSSCSSSGPPENDVASFGANGLLGLGVFVQDCGPGCVQSAIPGRYYSCPASGCKPVQVALVQQLQNPVALFSGDNNGVVIVLPSIAAAGVATVNGSLIFGIGTQANNGVSGYTILAVDANTGNLTTIFNNQPFADSYIDTGSNGFFFGTNAFALCAGALGDFYCPPAPQNLAATMKGTNGATSPVSFSVGNALQLITGNPSYNAFNNLAGTNSDPSSFAWGLPFFYGRTVFTAIEGKNTPSGAGPYVAF